MRDVDTIITELWGDTPVTYELLNGGYVNFTYKIQVDNKCFVLRINGKQNDYLGLNRKDEVEAIRVASEMGIAPRVLPQSNSEYLITEFIDAQILSREESRQPAMICNIAEVLKKIHRIQGIDRKFSPFDLLDRHLNGMKTLHIPFPKELDECLPEADAIQKRWDRSAAYRKAYCHNDYYALNILNASGRLYAIDWELSGEGDIFFDLATIAFSNAFSKEMENCLLQCYFGQIEKEHLIYLRDMKYMNMLREATWGLLHSGMGENTVNHEMDYGKWGETVLKRLSEGLLDI